MSSILMAPKDCLILATTRSALGCGFIRLTSIDSEVDPFVIRAYCDVSCDLRVAQLAADENLETVSVAKSYAVGVTNTPFNEIDGFRFDVQPYREFPPKQTPNKQQDNAIQ